MNDTEADVFEAHSSLRLSLFIGGAVTIAAAIVVVSLAIYDISGTAQLDLSRPEYANVRQEAIDDSPNAFPDSGVITEETLHEFRTTYEEQAVKTTKINAFDAAALSDDTLGLGGLNP